MDKARYLEVLDEAGGRLVAAASSPEVPVRSCPDWSIADLVWHVGVVFGFWRQLVDGTIAGPREFAPGDRPPDAELAVWLAGGLTDLSAVLATADPDQPVWTWADDHTAGFVQRWMAHEATVHAWDADDALGRAQPFADDVAFDGVDELLDAFLARVAVPARFTAGDRLHLHATEDRPDGRPGEWLVAVADGAWVVEHVHAKGTFAARGGPSDLLLALWGRVSVDQLSTFGEQGAFDELLDGLRASMIRR